MPGLFAFVRQRCDARARALPRFAAAAMVAAAGEEKMEIHRFSDVRLMTCLSLALARPFKSGRHVDTAFSVAAVGRGLSRALNFAHEATIARLLQAAPQAIGRRMASPDY